MISRGLRQQPQQQPLCKHAHLGQRCSTRYGFGTITQLKFDHSGKPIIFVHQDDTSKHWFPSQDIELLNDLQRGVPVFNFHMQS